MEITFKMPGNCRTMDSILIQNTLVIWSFMLVITESINSTTSTVHSADNTSILNVTQDSNRTMDYGHHQNASNTTGDNISWNSSIGTTDIGYNGSWYHTRQQTSGTLHDLTTYSSMLSTQTSQPGNESHIIVYSNSSLPASVTVVGTAASETNYFRDLICFQCQGHRCPKRRFYGHLDQMITGCQACYKQWNQDGRFAVRKCYFPEDLLELSSENATEQEDTLLCGQIEFEGSISIYCFCYEDYCNHAPDLNHTSILRYLYILYGLWNILTIGLS